MKPRHVRRAVVALAACGALLLVSSLVLGFLDGSHGPRADNDNAVDGHEANPDDPGGFRRFQDELVRRKVEELAERRETGVTTSTTTTRGTSEDAVKVSEEDAVRFIRAASRWNEHRLQRVQEVCARHNLGLYRSSASPPDVKLPPTPQYSVFYYDRSHKMAWCPLYKAGSTSLLYNLCLLGGYSERELRDTKEQLSTLARKAYPELEYPEAEEALRGSRRVLVVRHPLARLLSAYRDKLENRVAGAEHGTAHFYRKYGRRIVAKYRAGGARTPTSRVLRLNQTELDPDRPQPAGDEPTFGEFVRYLIDVDLSSYADDHWIPYYLFCTPCLINYDIIAKVETYLEDQVYLIRALGLQDSIRPRWRHRTASNVEGEKRVSDDVPTPIAESRGLDALPPPSALPIDSVARKYFSQITERQLRALHDKYRLDFELFDYSMEDYLPFVSKE